MDVLQDSTLAPLLFNLFVNDPLTSLYYNTLTYADNLKIYKEIVNITDCESLQSNLLFDFVSFR